MESNSVVFRPHARLLTMLGEQLIKNDRIALVELVKNSYDADATVVSVDFRGFGPDLQSHSTSAIVITDNGVGMSESVLRTVWMNPATPTKRDRKAHDGATQLGRVMQGEKGIGRFASFKLGSKVSLVSRALNSATETTVSIDVSELDEANPEAERVGSLYLDELTAAINSRSPIVFVDNEGASQHGTQLSIGSLRSSWNRKLFEEAFDDLERMRPLMWGGAIDSPPTGDFVVKFLIDGKDQMMEGRREAEFTRRFERAVLHISDGHFDPATRTFRFLLNERPVTLNVDDPEIRGLRIFRNWFTEDSRPEFDCGPFGFEFYIFDFSSGAPDRFRLDRDEKLTLKNHRIYLYRDGIRVYPYGDPDDDWLQVDAIRGTQSARSMFSNDQSVGYVTISQEANPKLRDKTNREGLLDAGRASGDFVVLIQTLLTYLRAKPYEQYAATNRRVRERNLRLHGLIDGQLSELQSNENLPANLRLDLSKLANAVASERELSSLQLARTQDLAGVGLSVETASHDLITAGSESLRLARRIHTGLREHGLSSDPIYGEATSLVQRLEFVDSRFQDVQGLFVSTRQKRAYLDIAMYLRRVRSMYAGLHEAKQIDFEIDDSISLRASTTEAAILQCFINLVDNATYWLMESPHQPRRIRAFMVGSDVVAISDNGPGISEQDAPFIFEPFYSGKGDSGKGLGLFIAREVGARNGFTVDIDAGGETRTLGGATFRIEFEEVLK